MGHPGADSKDTHNSTREGGPRGKVVTTTIQIPGVDIVITIIGRTAVLKGVGLFVLCRICTA